jgi:hypothetical protein
MADGSIKIDTKLDSSQLDKQVNGLKKTLDDSGKSLTSIGKISFAKFAGAVTVATVAIGATVKVMGELVAAYNVQAEAERALEQASKNNPYLNSESVQQLKSFASELQKVSNYGDEMTLGLMTQLASAGRTQDEIQRIIKASADLASSGAMSFESAVKNLNKTYAGMTGELGESIPTLKTLTAEQLKNGEAVDMIAKQYAGMAQATVNANTQMKNAMGDLKEELGQALAPAVETVQGWFGKLAGAMAEVISKSNEIRELNDKIKDGTATTTDKLALYKIELENLNKEYKNNLGIAMDGSDAETYMSLQIKEQIALKEEQIKRAEKLAELEKKTASQKSEAEAKALAQAQAQAQADELRTKKTQALVQAYAEWEKAQKRARTAFQLGVSTGSETWEELKRAAEEYQNKLADIVTEYGALGEASSSALEKSKEFTDSTPASPNSPLSGMFDGFVDSAMKTGEQAGKGLTQAMSWKLDETAVAVMGSLGSIASGIGAVFQVVVGVVSKIFSGISKIAKFDPKQMYESLQELLKGLTDFFVNDIGSLPALAIAGKELIFNFIISMLDEANTKKESMSNIIKSLLDTAMSTLPLVIAFGIYLMTNFILAVMDNLPQIIELGLTLVLTLITGLLTALPQIIIALANAFPSLIMGIVEMLPLIIEAIINALPELVTALVYAFIMFFITYWLEMYIMIPLAIISSLPAIFGAISEAMNNLSYKLTEMLSDLFKKIFVPSGESILEGIWNGIKKGWTKFGNDFKALFSGLGSPPPEGDNAFSTWLKGLFNAGGTTGFRGGSAVINEDGAELVTLPSGSRVMTASATNSVFSNAMNQLLAGLRTNVPSVAGIGSGGGNVTIVNKIDAPVQIDGTAFGRLVYETIDRAVI